MSLGPAEGRGGDGTAKDRMAALRGRKKLSKASSLSVVEEMSSAARQSAEAEAAAPAEPVQAPVEAAAEIAAPAPAPASEAVPVIRESAVPAGPAAPPARAEAPEPLPEPVAAAAPVAEPGQPKAKKPEKEGHKKTGFWQTMDQWERTRSTYDSTRNLTQHKTLAEYVAAAVEMYDKFNEDKYNDGQPFDSDPYAIPKGRPVGR